jgi:hypothetical protein
VLASNASLYATTPILSRTSNGPQYLGARLAQLPSFSMHYVLICITSMLVLGRPYFMPNFSNFLLHSLKHFSTKYNCVYWITHRSIVLYLIPYKASLDSFSMVIGAYCYMKTLPSVNTKLHDMGRRVHIYNTKMRLKCDPQNFGNKEM